MATRQKDGTNPFANTMTTSRRADQCPPDPSHPFVRKMGYLRKLKTMKKKFFVLHEDSSDGPARLEYFDSEKKWRAGAPPKQAYELRTCFNINRKVDPKHKHVLALYTKDKCFAMAMDDEDQLNEWLMAMLELQNGSEDGENPPKPNFEHVWQVDVKCRGLGSSRNLAGRHQLCLTAKVLTLVRKKAQPDEQGMLKLPLWSIRRCGHSDKFFYVELGRSAVTGAGELWMQTEDTIIAQNMHEAILGAMKSSNTGPDGMGPLPRPRSASTSEKSKPIATRRPVGVVSPQPLAVFPPHATGRERCDSMPTRFRTVSEGPHDVLGTSPNSRGRYSASLTSGITGSSYERLRPHSVYGRNVSYSPPVPNKMPFGLGSGACSTDSAGSSHSIDEFDGGMLDFPHRFALQQESGEPSIQEENPEGYVTMAPSGERRVAPSLALGNLARPQAPEAGIAEVGTPGEYLDMGPSPYLHHQAAQRNRSLDLGSTPSSPADGSDYLDMASPSQHDDGPNEYVPMSPLGTNTTSDSSFCQMTPGSHRSYATTAENTPDEGEGPDGYMPMAPVTHDTKSPLQLSDEGYLSMAPLSTSLPKSGESYIASPKRGAQSLQDVTLGSSPRGDPFRLDKIMKAYASPSEEEAGSYMKPVRAYSIGSRPQLRKAHLTAQHLDATRVRACSVGSQARPRKGQPTPIEAELGTLRDIDAKASRKSSSAPLLGAMRPRLIPAIGKVTEDSQRIEGATWEERVRRFSMGSRQRSNSRSSAAGPSPMSSLTEFLEGASKDDNQYVPMASLPHDVLQGKPVLGPARPEEGAMSFGLLESRPWMGPSLPDSPCARMLAESLNMTTLSAPSPAIETQLPVPAPMSQPVSFDTPKGTISMASELEGDYVDLDLGAKIVGPLVAPSTSTPKVPVIKTETLGTEKVQQVAAHDYMNYPPTQHSVEVQTQNPGPQPAKGSPVPGLANGDSGSKPSTIEKQASVPSSSGTPPTRKSSCPVMRADCGVQVDEHEGSRTPDRNGPSPSRELLRPASASYENVSVGGSAPGSRPPSVGNDCELNYASLDLAPPSSGDDEAMTRSPRSAPKPQDKEAHHPTYAEIDFTKSEGLRTTSGSLTREGRV